jgi:hypothetical protein
VHGQGRDLGDLPFLLADIGQVEDALQREADGAFADQRQGADDLVVVFGAQCGGGRQRMIW